MPDGTPPPQAQNDALAKRGRLDLSFAPDPAGKTYLDRQFSSYPFHICRPFYLDQGSPVAGMATVYTQSSSGGLYTQDRLVTTVTVKPGAQAHLTTQASTIVHRSTRGPALHSTEISVQHGGLIEYLPDPIILFPGAHLISKVQMTLAKTSSAILYDSFLAHDFRGEDEPFEGFDSEVRLCAADGTPLVIDRFRMSGQDFAKGLLGQMGGFACHGSVFVVMPDRDPGALIAACRQLHADPDEAVIGVSELPSRTGLSARILSKDAITLKRLMGQLWQVSRAAMTGARPDPRRK